MGDQVPPWRCNKGDFQGSIFYLMTGLGQVDIYLWRMLQRCGLIANNVFNCRARSAPNCLASRLNSSSRKSRSPSDLPDAIISGNAFSSLKKISRFALLGLIMQVAFR